MVAFRRGDRLVLSAEGKRYFSARSPRVLNYSSPTFKAYSSDRYIIMEEALWLGTWSAHFFEHDGGVPW